MEETFIVLIVNYLTTLSLSKCQSSVSTTVPNLDFWLDKYTFSTKAVRQN